MNSEGYSKSSILRATLIAIVVAGALLVMVVMPAEYDIDPLGTGQILGLTGLSNQPASSVINETGALVFDEKIFVLAAYESLEYKYETDVEATFVFEWNANTEVTFDFHGEPRGGPEGFAESYDSGKSFSASGSFRSPFPGIHGWYFENRSFSEATITLRTSGFFSKSHLFRDGFIEVEEF